MYKDKADAPLAATLATTAPQKGKLENREPLVGLLGGELDLFALVGLGLGASGRAKELVLKGLLAELDERLKLLKEEQKRGRGRPKKDLPNIDIERAAAILGADDLWLNLTGKHAPTQKAALGLACQIDDILFQSGNRTRRLFGGTTTEKSFQDSISRGLRKIGEAGAHFLK